MKSELYSVRMQASVKSMHISGAERIVTAVKIEEVVRELTARAMSRCAAPDRIVVKIESLGNEVPRELTSLNVITVDVPDAMAGLSGAIRVLERTGISRHAASLAIDVLNKGAAPSGGNMRGAMIMDARTGERLEPGQERGVRASRFDWSEEALKDIERDLKAVDLTHFRTREALALATKVAYAPGVVAELCWSDEPDYTAGYVASLQTGYVRFPRLKDIGNPKGGRVFFVNRDALNVTKLIDYLQFCPVLITAIGECRVAITPDEYFKRNKNSEPLIAQGQRTLRNHESRI
jgi:6-carboxyhexanoate--CoA ligase